MLHAIAPEDWHDFKELLRDYKLGRLKSSPQQHSARRPQDTHTSVVAILRDRLGSTGKVAAEVLSYQPDSAGYDIQATGLHAFPQGFSLADIPVPFRTDMTANEFRAILLASQSGPFIQSVTIGNERGSHFPMRWRLQLNIPQHLANPFRANVDWIKVTPSHYHGTGRLIEVSCPLIFDEVTPLRCGSQVVCTKVTEAGWVVIAAEPRQFVVGDANAFPV